MKKLFTFLSLIAAMSVGTTYAQSFSIDRDTTYISGSTFLTSVNNVTVPAGSPVTLQWAVISSTFPSDWMNNNSAWGVCDNTTCLGASDLWPTTYKSATYPGGATGDFHVNFDLSILPPGGPFVFRVKLKNGATDTAIQTYIVSRTPAASVNNVKSVGEVSLYPNPATTALNVVYDASADVKNIAIYNIIGKQVSLFRATDNSSANLNVENIPSGIYFVRLLNSHGDVVTTRKFTKQ